MFLLWSWRSASTSLFLQAALYVTLALRHTYGSTSLRPLELLLAVLTAGVGFYALGARPQQRTVILTFEAVAITTAVLAVVAKHVYITGTIVGIALVVQLLSARDQATPSAQTPYAQTPYAQTPYGQTPYGQTPYGQPGLDGLPPAQQWLAPPPFPQAAPPQFPAPQVPASYQQMPAPYQPMPASYQVPAPYQEPVNSSPAPFVPAQQATPDYGFFATPAADSQPASAPADAAPVPDAAWHPTAPPG